MKFFTSVLIATGALIAARRPSRYSSFEADYPRYEAIYEDAYTDDADYFERLPYFQSSKRPVQSRQAQASPRRQAPTAQPQARPPQRAQPQARAPAPQAQAPAPQLQAPAPQVQAPGPQVQAPAPQVQAPAPQFVNRPNVRTDRSQGVIPSAHFSVSGNTVKETVAYNARHIKGQRINGDKTLQNTRHTHTAPLDLTIHKELPSGHVVLRSQTPVTHEQTSRQASSSRDPRSGRYTIGQPITSITEIHAQRTAPGELTINHQVPPVAAPAPIQAPQPVQAPPQVQQAQQIQQVQQAPAPQVQQAPRAQAPQARFQLNPNAPAFVPGGGMRFEDEDDEDFFEEDASEFDDELLFGENNAEFEDYDDNFDDLE